MRERYRKASSLACESSVRAARVASMSELSCTARRLGEYESRTEEYELAFTVDDTSPNVLQIKYQAARAYEINAALEACTEAARAAIAGADPDLAYKPTDQSLFQLSWKTLQSVKYGEGVSKKA